MHIIHTHNIIFTSPHVVVVRVRARVCAFTYAQVKVIDCFTSDASDIKIQTSTPFAIQFYAIHLSLSLLIVCVHTHKRSTHQQQFAHSHKHYTHKSIIMCVAYAMLCRSSNERAVMQDNEAIQWKRLTNIYKYINIYALYTKARGNRVPCLLSEERETKRRTHAATDPPPPHLLYPLPTKHTQTYLSDDISVNLIKMQNNRNIHFCKLCVYTPSTSTTIRCGCVLLPRAETPQPSPAHRTVAPPTPL